LLTSDLNFSYLEYVHELRGVLNLYLEEEILLSRRDVVVLALFPLLPGVLLLGAVAAAMVAAFPGKLPKVEK
jgi:hypothetical protein